MRIRLDKRARLLASGQDAYPVAVERTTTLAAIRETHPDLAPDTATGDVVGIAGRVIFLRNSGKLCFATLREGGAGDTGTELQVMVSLASVGEQSLADFKSTVDLGDLIFVHGEVVSSRRGELSVLADRWQVAAKAIRPLPVAHKPLAEDTRVRQRYVDLIVRPQARRTVEMRAAVNRSLRSTLTDRGFLEVETPILQNQAGGATARPFVTHMNAMDLDLYLRIAPELFLKRCVVGGIDRVFEINRNFRNEGVDSSHSPEFAMLESYQAYTDYDGVAELTQTLIQNAAVAVAGSTLVVLADGSEFDLGGDWTSITLYGALSACSRRGDRRRPPRWHVWWKSQIASVFRSRRITVPESSRRSCSRNSSSTRWWPRRSSATSRPRPRHSPGITAASPAWPRSGTCTSAGSRPQPVIPNWLTRSSSGSDSPIRPRW